jgi:hypothetical protein
MSATFSDAETDGPTNLTIPLIGTENMLTLKNQSLWHPIFFSIKNRGNIIGMK